jgi:hypothetical protein
MISLHGTGYPDNTKIMSRKWLRLPPKSKSFGDICSDRWTRWMHVKFKQYTWTHQLPKPAWHTQPMASTVAIVPIKSTSTTTVLESMTELKIYGFYVAVKSFTQTVGKSLRCEGRGVTDVRSAKQTPVRFVKPER